MRSFILSPGRRHALEGLSQTMNYEQLIDLAFSSFRQSMDKMEPKCRD